MVQKNENDGYISGVPLELQPMAPDRRKVSKEDVVYTGIKLIALFAFVLYRTIDKAFANGEWLLGISLLGGFAALAIYAFVDILRRYRRGEEMRNNWTQFLSNTRKNK